MLDRPTQSKRLLSHTIAEGAYSRRYEHLSPLQATKLLSFDSIGCALGGSQQDDAKILLAHYRAAGGDNGAAAAFAGPVFVATGHGEVLAQLRAATESNILNLLLL